MSKDEDAAAKEWKEFHAAIKEMKLDDKGVNWPNIEYMYDGFFTGFYAGRDHQKNKGVEEAMHIIREAMIDDEPGVPGSYAHSWHCNIAMMCYDAMCSGLYDDPQGFDHERAHKVANDAASRFMKLCFDVETKG